MHNCKVHDKQATTKRHVPLPEQACFHNIDCDVTNTHSPYKSAWTFASFTIYIMDPNLPALVRRTFACASKNCINNWLEKARLPLFKQRCFDKEHMRGQIMNCPEHVARIFGRVTKSSLENDDNEQTRCQIINWADHVAWTFARVTKTHWKRTHTCTWRKQHCAGTELIWFEYS